jgi:putative aldouronate transport system permease protein
MDGAGHFWIFARIVAPLSKPVFAVLSIFSIVGFWNSYFTALSYLSSPEKQPLMILLRKLVIVGNVRGETESIIVQFGQTISGLGMERAMKAAVIICSILPIVMVYPFMQKYLAKGIMIGAIRG